MKELKIVVGVFSILAIITMVSADIIPMPFPPSPSTELLKNVTVEPTEGYLPLTVNITGEVFNSLNKTIYYTILLEVNERITDESFVNMIVQWATDSFPKLAPNESRKFSINYTLTDEGIYNLSVIVVAETSPDRIFISPFGDEYNITVTVLGIWQLYDSNDNDKIEDEELMNAIVDWLDNKISDIQLINVIIKWLKS